MNMPRYQPIAINPNTSGPPAPPVSASYRPYGAPMPEQQQQQQAPPQHFPPPPQHLLNPPPPPPGHPPPGPPSSIPAQLEQIEARLRQIEQEEASRAAARARILAIRKREDEEFRMITERAEAEEEVRIALSALLTFRPLMKLSSGAPTAEEEIEERIHGPYM